MRLSSSQKSRILRGVERRLAEIQGIDLAVAQALVYKSSLRAKFEETPMYIAHCGVDQLVDLVIKDIAVQ